MTIDLITGHQGVSHISADQIATINNAMMDNFGANKVMRLVGGELTADGLTITISEGYWRVNGFDMEIQEGETLYIDPTTIGLSRIDDIYVEILQDIPTGAQRAEIYIALGEPSATPTAPDEPTAPYLNTDILLQIIKLARVTVSEGAMIMEDYSVAYNIVTPEDLAEVQTEVDTILDNTEVNGAVNMLPTDIATQVFKGATITHNSNGSYSVAKSTADSQNGVVLSTAFTLKAGTYYWCASQNGHSAIGSNDCYCFIKGINGTVDWYRSTDFDVNHKWGVITLTQDSSIQFGIIVGKGTSNFTFYPMITVASYDGDYVPYAKSNKELTDAFTNQVADSNDTYSPSKAYKVGEHCIYNNVIYKCITACSAAAWSVNQNCFEETTLTTAVTELNSALTWKYLGDFNSQTNINITDIDFTELYLYPYADTYGASILIKKELLTSAIKQFVCGGGFGSNNVFGFLFHITNTYVNLISAYSGGAGDVSSTAKFKIYYR